MFVDTTALADGADLEFDVCIVGSGPAGLVAARGLRGTGRRIGVLESGGFRIDQPTQDLHRGRITGIHTWDLISMRWRLFGGSTERWEGWCKPLRAEDFAPKPWMPRSGWPIALSDIEPHYPAARALFDLTDLPFDAAAVAKIEGKPPPVRDTERLRNEVFQYSPPTRLGRKLRDEFATDEEITVHLWANVVEIVLEAGHGRVDHLAVRTLGGLTARVRAGVFVLAAGGVENPRLLLASSAQIPEGVANSSGFVGRCFMEHPHCYSSAGWVLPESIDTAFFQKRKLSTGATVRGVLALSREARAAAEVPGFTVEVVGTEHGSAATGPLPPETVVAAVAGKPGEQFLRFSLRMEQSPDPDSRITLDLDQRDAVGLPRVHLHWRVRDDDRHRMARALAIVGAELAAQGLGRLWTPTDAEGAFAWRIMGAAHHMGTTRMSSDPANGVVDANSRTHDVANLYVLGSSVFPTGSDSNPTLTIAALAERFAAHLRSLP